jgi:hypothetical protein
VWSGVWGWLAYNEANAGGRGMGGVQSSGEGRLGPCWKDLLGRGHH